VLKVRFVLFILHKSYLVGKELRRKGTHESHDRGQRSEYSHHSGIFNLKIKFQQIITLVNNKANSLSSKMGE